MCRSLLLGLVLCCALPLRSAAFEFFDGRLQVHGFYEQQIRAIARDLDANDDFDITQLAHVLNLEFEADIAPDGWGIFDHISGFSRIEVRYDCIWSHGCGVFPSADAYGDDVNKLPKRLFDGRRAGLVGNVPDFEELVLDSMGNPVLGPTGVPLTRPKPDLRGYRGELPTVAGLRGPFGVQDFVDPRDSITKERRQFIFGARAGEYEIPLDVDVDGERRAFSFASLPGISSVFRASGFDRILGNEDDPANFVFSDLLRGSRCRFSTRKRSGSEGGIESLPLGPHDPRCFVQPLAALDQKPNPLRGRFAFYNRRDASLPGGETTVTPIPELPDTTRQGNLNFERDKNLPVAMRGDVNPILAASTYLNAGSGTIRGGDLPYRPAPIFRFDSDTGTHPGVDGFFGTADDESVTYSRDQARGLWYPNAGLARMLRKDELAHFGANFRESELAWNRGQSQQDEKELKEIYLDLELFDSRLWLRAGKQQIVWGKTELFRNQDQFNPQDFALSSLPSLEESRIGLWALRGVWSFYDVGEFEDVRLEVAVNFDQFEPPDFGRCGEPYAVSLICSAYFGFLAHGHFGAGLAGVVLPEDPWDDLDGIEVGARVEWRWNRFSFALTDFWGYQDIPYIDQIFHYERNVDPRSGRPRETNERGACITGTEPACLTPAEALTRHSINLTAFAVGCASTIGLTENTPFEACSPFAFNSHKRFNGLGEGEDVAGTGPFPVFDDIADDGTYASIISNLYAANGEAVGIASGSAPGAPSSIPGVFSPYPFVRLNVDPCDGFLADCVTADSGQGGVNEVNIFFSNPFNPNREPTINGVLTQHQKALLGCGEFYSTNCELDGFDLANSEASFLAQSFVGIEGTSGTWSVLDATVQQPGTVNAADIPVATRYEDGRLYILPGARGANDLANVFDDDSGYLATVDGCTGPGPVGCNAAERGSIPVEFGGGTDARLLYHPLAGRLPGADGQFNFATASDDPSNDDFFDCGSGAQETPCQIFRSEGAALSFNAQVVLSGLSLPPKDDNFGGTLAIDPLEPPEIDEISATEPFRLDGCSFAKPQFCRNFSAFMSALEVQRNSKLAGGNERFGRRDFAWQQGSPVVIRWQKRNVLGFSTDFAEDYTKSNWSLELTWVKDTLTGDNNSFDGLKSVDNWNLTVSVDRPTFINFLNANRTFFINSQMFIQYIDGYESSFPGNGPWNFLATLAVTTGYFQDRLLPTMIFVYDKRSNSGAFLPQVSYRFTENFSATFGMSLFSGRVERKTMALSPISSDNRVGRHAYKDSVVNGLSAVRERDELYLRIKYTF